MFLEVGDSHGADSIIHWSPIVAIAMRSRLRDVISIHPWVGNSELRISHLPPTVYASADRILRHRTYQLKSDI